MTQHDPPAAPDAVATYRLTRDAAQFYESTFVPALFAEWASRLADASALAPGLSVLDVACGTGIVGRTVAARLNHRAHVVGVDLNPAMLAVARRADPQVIWQDGDAAALPFGDGEFDRTACQAALMFFPEPVTALREMRRVTRPGGRVVVHVPGRLSRSPGYLALADAVTAQADPDAASLLGSYFTVGDPSLLTDLISRAGLTVDTVDTWTSATRLDSVDTFLDAELLPLAGSVDPDTRARLRVEAGTALIPFTDPRGRIAAPLEAHLITAHRAGYRETR